jgi:hypothetical protein
MRNGQLVGKLNTGSNQEKLMLGAGNMFSNQK